MAVEKNKLEEEACVLRFYKIVLSWDYLRILKESDQNHAKRTEGEGVGRLMKVKETYRDVDEYLNTFEPLLFEEVKAQIVQGKDEEEETVWQQSIIAECSEINGFHSLVVICSDSDSLSQNDLLLLSPQKFGKVLPIAYAFALVEHRQQDKIKLRLYLNGEVKRINADAVQKCSRLRSMIPIVKEVRKYLHILKICSLSTIVREYVGIRSISSLPYKDLILKATVIDNVIEDCAWKLSRPLKEFIDSNHNESQLEAIRAGLSRMSFVLIQGPPGTGKTQTILGLLSAIIHATVHTDRGKYIGLKRGPELPLHEKYSHWQKASPWLVGTNPRDENMPKNGDDGYFPTSGNELKPEVVNSSRKYRIRVLVCAPSNSALDEIVLRLLRSDLNNLRILRAGERDRVACIYTRLCAIILMNADHCLRDEDGLPYRPKIVRIGLKPHHSVQSVSMDYLVEQKLAAMDSHAGSKQKQGSSTKDKDGIRTSILDEAVIVFSTLSFSGSTLFSKLNRAFDVVIIDEAAQAVEPATLIPLANGCKQVFLVGDPVQLPATVISPVAEKFGYGMSLFTRFQKAGYPVLMLKTQYRMNPEIRSFPSKEFYNEALEDGPNIEEQTRRAWHKFRCFGPFCFFDIHEGKESQTSGSGSWVNFDEVEFVLALYSRLVGRYPELMTSSRLAIISPYRHQVKLFREKFRIMFGVESDKVVDINTVDGFQGREKDVAIFSCVRASEDKGIGFVSDYRRMNVGITRARSSVLVVGSASTLRRDGHWKNLIENAEERKLLFKVSKAYEDFFSETNLKLMEVEEVMPATEEPPPAQLAFGMSAGANVGIDEAQPENDWGDAGGEPYDGEMDMGGYGDD